MKDSIIFIGDSITKGKCGVNWVDEISSHLKNYNIINKGLGGDTLIGISNRLLKKLRNNKYKIVVFSAGHNDVILPSYEYKNIFFKTMRKTLRFRGSIPSIDNNDFYDRLINLVNTVNSCSNTKLILVTLSLIGENLNSETNKRRIEINDIIRKVANENNTILADVGLEFDKAIINKHCSNYYLDSFFSMTYSDPKKCKVKNGSIEISKKRGLYLTIDGVHVNSHGAEIYRKVILDAINTVIK